jgi:hypothetical protein
MELSFGTRLRLQREQQQVALATIAEQTKIRVALLEGLERDDLSHWPMGVFRRSYFRAYAEAIGLKPDALLPEFLQLHPDPADDNPVVAAARVIGGEARRPPTRLRFLLGSAMRALPALRHQPSPAAPLITPAITPAAAESSTARAVRVVERDFSLVSPPRRVEPALPPDPEPAMDEECLTMTFDEPATTMPLLEHEAHEYPASEHREREEYPASEYSEIAEIAEIGEMTEIAEAPAVPSQPAPLPAPTPVSVELAAVARLSTRLARATDPRDLKPVLREVAHLVDAVGIVLWMWDARGAALLPVLSHGYPEELLAELHGVLLDDDNAITAAFRAVETRVVNGSGLETGAVVVPVTTPNACAGVLALELRNGREQHESVRAFATILAAQLSMLIGYPPVFQAATA